MKIAICSGYFNPLALNHIEYLENSRNLADRLIVILNNDYQVKLKRSIPFQSEAERKRIITSLRFVDSVILSVDTDLSVCKTLTLIYRLLLISRETPHLIFCNGGPEYGKTECREKEICDKYKIEMRFGIGGNTKCQSSSSLIANAAREYLERQ